MRNVVTGDAGRLTATRTKTLAAQRAKFRIARRCGRRITLLTALGSIDEFKRLPSRSHHANLTQTVSTLEKTRLVCPLVYQLRKTLSDSKKRQLQELTTQ